jgi:hypothetical protein
MNYKEEIEEFVIEGFERIYPNPTSRKSFVLKNKKDNFITQPQKGFEYHRWASSLKSSQAFAYNIFSGIEGSALIFEFHMKVFDTDAQIDVKIEKNQTIDLFEVKAFEIVKMEDIEFKEKYFTKTEYKRPEIAEPFIKFLNIVLEFFDQENRRIYGGGIKQLCSHLLGILNTMNDPEYENKNFKLYSLCFDNLFSPKFERDLTNYKNTLTKFKNLVDDFLIEINMDSRIEYFGFLSAREYMMKNKEFLGKTNYEYVIKRYFY